MSSSLELITEVYRAFNARNTSAVLTRMHPEVDWPNGMEGGRVSGHRAVREYWERQWAKVDPRVEPLHVEDREPNETAVSVHQVVRDLKGKVLSDRLIEHVYTIRAGLIVRMEIRDPGQSGT